MKIRWVWVVAAASAAEEARALHRITQRLHHKEVAEDGGDDDDDDDDADGPDAPDAPEPTEDTSSTGDPQLTGAAADDASEVAQEEKRAEQELKDDEEEQWESRREAILEGRAYVPLEKPTKGTPTHDVQATQYAPSQILATASLEETTEATEKLQKKEHALLKQQNDVLAKQLKVAQRQSLLTKAASELALRQHKVKMERGVAARQLRTLNMKVGVLRSELSAVFESERVVEAAGLEAKARKLLSVTPAPVDSSAAGAEREVDNSTLGKQNEVDSSTGEADEAADSRGKAVGDGSVSTLEHEVQELRHRLEASEEISKALAERVSRESQPAAWKRATLLGVAQSGQHRQLREAAKNSRNLQGAPGGSFGGQRIHSAAPSAVARKPIQVIPDEEDHGNAADVSEVPAPLAR
mmetsp:Transcript_53090/g.116486  ORF Transcript_53090/g.116486 Transcript_53090/m.116486 type:complete len:411 (+) Transcript_53090:82-1314(+)